MGFETGGNKIKFVDHAFRGGWKHSCWENKWKRNVVVCTLGRLLSPTHPLHSPLFHFLLKFTTKTRESRLLWMCVDVRIYIRRSSPCCSSHPSTTDDCINPRWKRICSESKKCFSFTKNKKNLDCGETNTFSSLAFQGWIIIGAQNRTSKPGKSEAHIVFKIQLSHRQLSPRHCSSFRFVPPPSSAHKHTSNHPPVSHTKREHTNRRAFKKEGDEEAES